MKQSNKVESCWCCKNCWILSSELLLGKTLENWHSKLGGRHIVHLQILFNYTHKQAKTFKSSCIQACSNNGCYIEFILHNCIQGQEYYVIQATLHSKHVASSLTQCNNKLHSISQNPQSNLKVTFTSYISPQQRHTTTTTFTFNHNT
jgi:hypothetical protein